MPPTRREAYCQSQRNSRWSLRIRAPGSMPASVRIWKPLHEPMSGPPSAANALDRGHDRREAGNRPGAQVIAVGEAAGQHDRVRLAELGLGVPRPGEAPSRAPSAATCAKSRSLHVPGKTATVTRGRRAASVTGAPAARRSARRSGSPRWPSPSPGWRAGAGTSRPPPPRPRRGHRPRRRSACSLPLRTSSTES